MGTYKVQENGSAPKGLVTGDTVVTGGGTYQITGVNADGTYQSKKVNDTTTSGFTGSYSQAATQVRAPKATAPAQVGSGGKATGGYTGELKATDPFDNEILVKYKDGKLDSDNIPDGTIVHTAGGDFVYYKDKTDTDAMTSVLMGLYSGNNSAYDQAQKAQEAANRAAVDRAVNDLEAQKTDTNNSYSDLFRQLYINKMNSQKNLDQKLAAQGITGGAAETNRLGLDTSYSEALRQGEQERIGTIGDLDRAIVDTRLTGDITTAQAAAENAIAKANSYAGVLQSMITRNDNLASNQQSTARAMALQIISGGDMPGDALLTAAGISKADAQMLLGQKTYTDTQAAAALAAAREGSTDPTVRAIIESYFKMPLEVVLAGQKNETTYTDAQVAAAVQAAVNGYRSDSIRAIIEGAYPGMSMEEVLAAYSSM